MSTTECRAGNIHQSVSQSLLPSYRSDIDGLRGLAVLSVVFYHAKLSCPGGFVGVDVFFVISGYLIAGLILKELQAGTFSIAAFWERRMRRIFPACAVMVLVTLVAGAFVPSAVDYVQLGQSALMQSVMASNLFFWRKAGGYFDQENFRPLLHTWSLAVEEQFYLLFPLGLWALFRFGQARRLSIWLLAAALGSLLLAAAEMSSSHINAAFYLLPERAWELLIGALLTVLPAAWLASSRWQRELVAWLGLAGILVPVWLYSDKTSFPGLTALPSCLGAAALIWANTQNGKTTTWPGRLLAARPLVFVGLISYSLYLWHWPVLAFANYGWSSSASVPVGVAGMEVTVAIVLALVSWRWVETPFRQKRIAEPRRAIFQLVATVSVLLILISASVVVSRGFPSRLSELVRQNEAALKDKGYRGETLTADVQSGRIPRFGAKSINLPPRVLLWGDSHAEHAVKALDVLCRNTGIAFEVITANGTPPVNSPIVP